MMTQPGLECPQCSKHSLVQRTNDLYICLNCNFKKDFAAPEPEKSDFNVLPSLGIIALLLVLLRTFPNPISPTFQSQSSPSEEVYSPPR